MAAQQLFQLTTCVSRDCACSMSHVARTYSFFVVECFDARFREDTFAEIDDEVFGVTIGFTAGFTGKRVASVHLTTPFKEFSGRHSHDAWLSHGATVAPVGPFAMVTEGNEVGAALCQVSVQISRCAVSSTLLAKILSE